MSNDAPVSELVQRLRRTVRNQELLTRALTHASYTAGKPDTVRDYERLEFLGDAILGAVVVHELFTRHPGLEEGPLSRMKASLVSAVSLGQVAVEQGIAPDIRLGRGEKRSAGRRKNRILADVIEAIVGAVYLDGGFDEARALIIDLLGERLASDVPAEAWGDSKTRLQEWTQSILRERPEYRLVSQDGPAHRRLFVIEVELRGILLGRGEGGAKKSAEQAAATEALIEITKRGGEAWLKEIATVSA